MGREARVLKQRRGRKLQTAKEAREDDSRSKPLKVTGPTGMVSKPLKFDRQPDYQEAD